MSIEKPEKFEKETEEEIASRKEIRAMKEKEEFLIAEQKAGHDIPAGQEISFHFKNVDPEKISRKGLLLFRKLKKRDLTKEEIDEFIQEVSSSENKSDIDLGAYLANQFTLQVWENRSRY